ncbi:MAG: hypothetical protein ACFFE2_05875 [Candidatus Thorarchaeota archaeon]
MLLVLLLISLTTLTTEPISAEGEIVVVRGNTILITVTLLQNGSFGEPVPDQWIHFFDQSYNSFLGSEKTDANGIASLSWGIPIDHALGMTTINATFLGNESLSLAPSYQWSVLTVVSSTTIEIDQVPDSLAPGDFLSFLVHLTDDTDSPIENASVKVFKDYTPIAVAKTNSSGDIHFKIDCNSTWITLGNNDIRVVFEQDLAKHLNGSEFTFIVDISKIPTFLLPHGWYPTNVTLGEFVDLYIELSETANPMPNEAIQVLLDDSPLVLVTSNNSGIARALLDIDERFTLGVHILQFLYNGTSRYSVSNYEYPLSITSPAQLSIEVPESASIGSIVDLEIAISDSLGRPIPDSLITLVDTTSDQTFTVPSSSTKTVINFQYVVQGPTGTHILNVEVSENLFVTNGNCSATFVAWSKPVMFILNVNVDHYASPNQEIFFELQMTDWNGNCSYRPLYLMLDGQVYLSRTTGIDGKLTLALTAPLIEKVYNISMVYEGNNTLFESPTKLDYDLHVTSQMPVRLELDSYEVNAARHELDIRLILKAFNGSTLQGVNVNFVWLDSHFDSQTSDGGLVILHLRVPAINGIYVLYYEIEDAASIVPTNGTYLIEITISDVMSLQGIGVVGLAIALFASVGISAVPILRRRYLVG